jgi:hypothetical protein
LTLWARAQMAPVIPAAIFTQIALKKKLGPDDREDFS